MANGYTEEDVKVASIYQDLRGLKESADMLFNVVDMADATTWAGEDGTPKSGSTFDYAAAYTQCLIRPSSTAGAYINEMGLRMLRARSRAFCISNPYWMAVRENRIAYAVGTGHVFSIEPKRKGKKLKESLVRRVSDELHTFCHTNRYRRRQGEKITRLDRDGEYFMRYFEDRPDGVLRVRFVEPILVQNPPGKGPEQSVWFGIQFDGSDYEEPIRYHIRETSYDGGLVDNDSWGRGVPADEIQHRTANVDLGSPRGIPTTYVLQDSAVQAVSTLKSMGRLVDIRARIALIRKQVNATLGQIQPLLLRNRSGTSINAAGQVRNAFSYPYGTVLDTNDQRTYEFPSQHIETDKIVNSLKSDLQAVAAAIGLADFTISGDSSGSFANALIKEGPMDRAIARLQKDLIDDDMEVYERALSLAASRGRLPSNVLKMVRLDVMPPGVIARDRLVNTQADEILVRNGAMSPDTMAMRANLDPTQEREKSKANPSPQLTGNGDKRSNQPGMSGKATARAIPKNDEPGPKANPNATG